MIKTAVIINATLAREVEEWEVSGGDVAAYRLDVFVGVGERSSRRGCLDVAKRFQVTRPNLQALAPTVMARVVELHRHARRCSLLGGICRLQNDGDDTVELCAADESSELDAGARLPRGVGGQRFRVGE